MFQPALEPSSRYVIGPLELAPDDMVVVTHHTIGYRLEPEPRKDRL